MRRRQMELTIFKDGLDLRNASLHVVQLKTTSLRDSIVKGSGEGKREERKESESHAFCFSDEGVNQEEDTRC